MASFRLPLISSSSEARTQRDAEVRTASVKGDIATWAIVAVAVIAVLAAIQSVFTGQPTAVLSYLP
jgi:hypothetical protein